MLENNYQRQEPDESYTNFEPVAEEVPEFAGATQAVEENEVYTDFELSDPEEETADFRHSPAGSWTAGLLGWDDDEDRRMQAESAASLKEKRERLESLSHVALRKKSDEYRILAGKNRWVTRDDLGELNQEAKTLLGRDVIAAIAPAYEEVPDLYLEARGILPKDGKPRKRTELYQLAWADFEISRNDEYDEFMRQNRILQEKYTNLLPKFKRLAMGDVEEWTPDEADTLAKAGVSEETIDRLGNAGHLLSKLSHNFEVQDSDALAIMDAVGLTKPRKEWNRDDELVYNIVLQAYGEVKKQKLFHEWGYDADGNDTLQVARPAKPGLDTLKANVELFKEAYRPLGEGEGFSDRAREIFQTNLKLNAQFVRPIAQAGRAGGQTFARMVLPVRNVDDERFKALAGEGASWEEMKELTHTFRNDLAAADMAAANGTLEKMSWAQNAGVMFGKMYAQTVPWIVGGGVGGLAKGAALGRAALAGRAAGLAARTTEAAGAATGARAATLAARGEFLSGLARHERLFRWGGKLAPKAGEVGLGALPSYNMAQVDSEVEGQALGLSPEEIAVYSRLHAFSGTASEFIGLHALTKVPFLKKGVDWLTRRGGWQSGLLRSAYNRSAVAQTLIHGAGVVAEEGIAEPVAEGLMNRVGNRFLTDERAKTHLNGEWVRQIVAGLDPTTGQGAALLFYSAIGTAPNVQSFGATARAYTKSLEHWKALGGTEAGWREAATIAKPEDRDTFTRRHLTTRWQKNPEKMAEQLKALNEEYRKTEFVSQLAGMTSYKIMQEQGLIDPTVDNADGSITVYLKEDGKEERTPVTMSPEAYNVYVASRVSKNAQKTVVDVQDLLNAEQTGDALQQQGNMEVVDMPGPLTAQTAQSLGRQIKALIAKLEAEGLTTSEALDTVDVSISNTLSLGEMLGVVEGFEERVKLAKERGELGEQEEAASYAFVVRKNAAVGDAMRLVLLRAKGLATNSQMFEETMEQGALARMRELNGGEEVTPEMVRAYGEALQQLQRELNERDGGEGTQFIDVKKEAPGLRDVVEAFSLMGRSHLLREMMAGRSSLPDHVQAPFLYAARYMDRFADQARLADALADALKRDSSGQIQGMLDVMQSAVDAVYESPAAREPFEIEEARRRFEAMKQAWKKAEEQEKAALGEEGQIEEPGRAQVQRTGTGEAHFSLADNSPLHIYENGIQYTRNGSFYTAEVDLAAPGMAVEGGVSETEGSGVATRPDGRTDAGAGSGVQQGQSDRLSGGGLEESGRIESGLQDGRRVRLLTKRLHRFGGTEQEKAVQHGFYTGDLCELVPGRESAVTFKKAIKVARQSRGLYGECVYVYPAEEYEHMRLFITPDGMAGVALKEDGDMVSVFTHADQRKNGNGNAASSLIALAINEGAVKGDCYGRKLVELYGRFGFRAIAKDQFNPEFASEPMQNEDAMRANFPREDGRPDVVYLVYEGSRSRVLDEYDPTYIPDYQTELEYTDYDACLERQNEAVEKQRQKESGASSNFSVIGEHAATWDKHRGRALTGRADGKARAELDASQAELIEDGVRAARREAVPLGKFVNFPDLFEAYPQLASLPVRFSEDMGHNAAGSLSVSPDSGEQVVLLNDALRPEAVLPALLHEVQHAIQGIEGFAPGGTLLDAYTVYTGRLNGMIDRFNNGNKSGELPRLSGDITQAAAELNELLVILADRRGEDAAALRAEAAAVGSRLMEIYRDMPGEVEARRVAERLRMKAAERARVDFSVTALGPVGNVLTPDTFITRPDGNPDWFVLPARKGQPAMPVRLLAGQDKGAHSGYGLTHIAASRDAEGLWKHTSPARYLADILANVSELWEVVPGREIIVKGKTPSSWMVLQLDSAEGYYSIVTAYPMRGSKKPLGKKLPLAERSVAQGQQPANAKSGTARLGPGSASETALPSQSAGGEDATSLPQGARVVNINDVQLRFDDGGMMPAAFSIQDAGDLLGILSRLQAAAEGIDLQGDKLYDAPIIRMRAAVTRQMERLSRYEDDGESGSGLAELASAYVLLDEVERALPGNYGFGLEAYKTWTQFFVRLMKTGRIDEAAATLPMSGWPEVMQASIGRQVEEYLVAHPEATAAEFLQEYGEKRLMRLVGKFMERARQQLDRYRKDVELGRLRRVVAAVAPRRNAQGKPLRSKMAADDYRELERLMRLVNMTSGQYDEAIDAWERKKDANGNGRDFNEAKDEEEMLVDVYDASGERVALPCTVREFRTLGSWERMSVGEAMAARSVLGELIATGRLSWDAALDRRRSMLSEQAERLDAAFSNLTEMEKKELLKAFRNKKSELNVFAPMESLAQFLDVLRVVPGLGDVADGWARRLDAAITAIREGERERYEYLAQAIEKATGFREKKQQLDWLEKMRQSRDTGIDVTEQAPDFKASARDQYRKRVIALLLRKKRSKGEKAVGDAVRKLKGLDTELADELRVLFPEVDGHHEYALDEVLTDQELQRYGDAGKYVDELAARNRAKSKKWSDGSEYMPRKQRLSLTPASAANLVLLGEQEDYREYFQEKGYTEEVFEQLRAFAGNDMMNVAYAMREYMGRNGEAVKALVESRYGVPYALTDNYWRAYFDVQGEVREEEIAQGCGFGNAQGTGTFGSIHARRKHRANLDLTMDAFTVFNTAMGEQDALLNLSELHHDMVGFMNFKDEMRALSVGNSLLRALSVGDKDRLTAWTKTVARAGTERVRGLMELDQCAILLQSATARAVLAGRFGTLAKQTTAVLNTLYGSELVTGREYARSFGRVLSGQGVMPLSEMAKEPELKGRGNASYAELADVLRLAEDQKRERGGFLNRLGMNALDKVDVGFNVVSACVTYDAVYRRLQADAPDMDAGALHAAAMSEVRKALNIKSQAQMVFNKPMLAQTKHPLSLMTLFLKGETFIGFGAMARLLRRGRTLGGFKTSEGRREYAKIVPMWLLNGAILSAAQAIIDFMQDDEKRRKKRTVREYLLGVALGPIQGVPGIDFIIDLATPYGHHSSSVSPISLGDMANRFERLYKKNASWHDYVLATNDLVRGMAVGLVYYNARHRSTSKASMAVTGTALSAAFLSNCLDFIVKTERAIEERW